MSKLEKLERFGWKRAHPNTTSQGVLIFRSPEGVYCLFSEVEEIEAENTQLQAKLALVGVWLDQQEQIRQLDVGPFVKLRNILTSEPEVLVTSGIVEPFYGRGLIKIIDERLMDDCDKNLRVIIVLAEKGDSDE